MTTSDFVKLSIRRCKKQQSQSFSCGATIVRRLNSKGNLLPGLMEVIKHALMLKITLLGGDAVSRYVTLSFWSAFMLATLGISAHAQDFFAGKTMTIIVGYGQGGSGYDVNGRFVARHLSRFLPGDPTIIVQNMLGAGTLAAANHVANVAPKDGTTMALVARGMGIEQLMGGKNVRFDPLKINWIGSTSREVSVVLVRSDTGISSIKDATEREVVLAAIAIGTDGVTFPLALNNLLGTKFRPVMGYKSGGEMTLAMLRGETHGRGSWSWARAR